MTPGDPLPSAPFHPARGRVTVNLSDMAVFEGNAETAREDLEDHNLLNCD
jgi:hypothetical protein